MAGEDSALEEMTESERAEWFYENRAELAENATPAALQRVVSVRFSPEDLGELAEAAENAGFTPSAYIRKATMEAVRRSGPGPASVMSAEETGLLRMDVMQVSERMAHLTSLLERHGIVVRPNGDPPEVSAPPLVIDTPKPEEGRRGRQRPARREGRRPERDEARREGVERSA